MNLKTKVAILGAALLVGYKLNPPRVRLPPGALRRLGRGVKGVARMARRSRYAKLALSAAALYGVSEAVRYSGVVTPDRFSKLSSALDKINSRYIRHLDDFDINHPGSWARAAINIFESAASRTVAQQESKHVTMGSPRPDPLAPVLERMDLSTYGMRLPILDVWNSIINADMKIKWDGCKRAVLLTAEEMGEEGIAQDIGIIALGGGAFEESVCALVLVDNLTSHMNKPRVTPHGEKPTITPYRGAWAWLDDGESVAGARLFAFVAPCDPDKYDKAWEAARRFIWPSGTLLLESGSHTPTVVSTSEERDSTLTLVDAQYKMATTGRRRRRHHAANLAVVGHNMIKALSARDAAKARQMYAGEGPEGDDYEAQEELSPRGAVHLKPLALGGEVFFGEHTVHFDIWTKLLERGVQHHVMLHGKPGCGKTTLIRDFVNRSRLRALFVDHSAVHRMSQTMWQALMHMLGAEVLVFEDLDKAGSLDRRLWMFEHQPGVGLLFSTANDPHRFSQAARRAGRLGDQVIRVGKPAAPERARLVNNLIWRNGLEGEAMTEAVRERAVKLCATHPISAVERFLIFASHVGADLALSDLPGDVTYDSNEGGQIEEDDFETQHEIAEEQAREGRERHLRIMDSRNIQTVQNLQRDISERGGFDKLPAALVERYYSSLCLYELEEVFEDGEHRPEDGDPLALAIGAKSADALRSAMNVDSAEAILEAFNKVTDDEKDEDGEGRHLKRKSGGRNIMAAGRIARGDW